MPYPSLSLWGLLRANLLDNELLVGGNVSVELGNGPVVADPELVCGSGNESLIVRDTENYYRADPETTRLTR